MWEEYKIHELEAGMDPFPLCTQFGGRYFWTEDDLLEHCVEHDVLPSEMRLVHAAPMKISKFDLREHLESYLPDDDDADLPLSTARIDAVNSIVNDAIDDCGTMSYRSTSERPHPDLVKKWDEAVLAEQDEPGFAAAPAAGGDS